MLKDLTTDLVNRDLNCLWHPCSQMKDYEVLKPLVIKKAYGSYLELEDGHKVIDAISSWWCKSLGHGHPVLKQALIKQLEKFEHVILANTTNEGIVQLTEKLTGLLPNLSKAFYASEGSSAIEIALKMSLQFRHIRKQHKKTIFMGLKNGYHGETNLALSVSDVGIYKEPFKSISINCPMIEAVPYVSGPEDPLWHDIGSLWDNIEKQLLPLKDQLSAIIVEPILQGASGMLVYSPDFLKRLYQFTQLHDIHFIADEIMTGFGRTGYPLACQHANIEPDFICVSKGLTSGWLPLSAVLTTDAIYQTFYDDWQTGKAFMHSHTFCGNSLAVSVANACLETLESENIYHQAQNMGDYMKTLMLDIQNQTKLIHNVRGVGAMVAADLISSDPTERLGFRVFQTAIQLGALLRPLGNTLYWLPPLNTDKKTLMQLHEITLQAIDRLK